MLSWDDSLFLFVVAYRDGTAVKVDASIHHLRLRAYWTLLDPG